MCNTYTLTWSCNTYVTVGLCKKISYQVAGDVVGGDGVAGGAHHQLGWRKPIIRARHRSLVQNRPVHHCKEAAERDTHKRMQVSARVSEQREPPWDVNMHWWVAVQVSGKRLLLRPE